MRSRLESFLARNQQFRDKGSLCVALVVTCHARDKSLPLDPEQLITHGGGQVLGLGKQAVQNILLRHGIGRVLAQEGGRTSRGSLGNMRTYVEFLNGVYQELGSVDLDEVEQFWVQQVERFFAAKPFTLRLDGSLSLRMVIRSLLGQAADRQREQKGTTFQGTMLQHLVGAMLDLMLGVGKIVHHSANQNDASEGRSGDFDVEDVSFHVSTAPTEALIQKCHHNLNANRRPILVTTGRGMATAEGLAGNAELGDRIDVLDAEQWFATHLYEQGLFAQSQRRPQIEALIHRYNELIDEHETDPSLRIELPPRSLPKTAAGLK